MDFKYEITNSVKRGHEIVGEMMNQDVLAFDLETTGLDWVTNKIHGVSLANADKAYYIHGKEALQDLWGDLSYVFGSAKLIVGHNIGFDMHFLYKETGIKLARGKIADTMVMAWLLDENQFLGLKPLSQVHLKIREELPSYNDLLLETKKLIGAKKKADVSIYDMPIEKLGEYAARDTRLTYDLYMKLRRDLAQADLLRKFVEEEMPFVYVLWDMEHTGMYIDTARLEEFANDLIVGRDKALERWNTITNGINPNSSPQLIEYFYTTLKHKPTRFTAGGKTGKKKPSTDVIALTRLKEVDTTGSADTLLQYREYEKMLGTYVETFREAVKVSPWIYGSFNRTGTVTGRLSANSPNLQNIPSHGEIGSQAKEVFAAPPGWKLVVLDYSQLELRLLAHYTKDEHLLTVFAEGGDPHQLTADRVGVERHIGKTLNFAWAYGSGPRTLADTIEKEGNPRPPESDTRRWLDGFNEAYPTLVDWKRRVLRYAKKLGYVKTINGRYRRLPDITAYDGNLRSRAERQAINAIIQGSASDILEDAMLQLSVSLPKYHAHMLAQVHDELVILAEDSVAEDVAKLAQHIMEDVGVKFDLLVPLIAEPGIAQTWAEAKG